MADENVTIGIKTTADNAGAKEAVKSFADISKETVAASKHATQLLYVISQLTKQLDGMDGDAAKALRQELANLSETINSLDLDRLKHLDSILANIAKTGADLSAEGFDGLEQNLIQLNAEANKFKETFSNENQVQVDVDVDGLDDLDALQKKIEGTAAANELVNSLKAIKDEAAKANDDAIKPMADELDRMIALASNADPQSVKQLRSSFASLAGQVEKLTATQKDNIKAFNFDKVSRQLDTLQNKVGTVASRMKNGGEAINATASILQGNLTALGNMLQLLIERTKAWSFAMTAVGAAKATAAMGIFVVGMNSLVNLAKQYVQHWREVTREMEKQRIMAVKQEAEQIPNNLKYADKVAERNERKREIDARIYRIQQEGVRNAEIATINLKRQQDLAGNFNETSRERINREADRKIEDIELQKELDAIANAEEDRQAKLAMAQARQKQMQKAKNALDQRGIDIANISNEAVAADPGFFKQWLMNIGDIAVDAGFKEEFEERIKNSSDTAQTISEIMKEIGQKMKDNEIEIADLEEQLNKTIYAKGDLVNKRSMINAARKEEDAQIAYRLENTQYARQREIAERERENAEADAQAELDHQATLQSMQEQRAALIKRRAQREAQLAQKEKELARFKGVAEADLAERDKQQRQWLEQDVERLRGQIRGDTSSIRLLDRQGNVSQYARQREIAERERENAEADAQAELDHQATLQSMQEQRAALIKRRAQREAQLAQKEKELARFKGVAEADLAERDKQQRQWLEQDVERLRGQIRGDTSSIRLLDRQGNVSQYARQREYYAEQRDEQEADRQMLRNWQNSRLGLGGRTADAQNELNLQKALLKQEQGRMQKFIEEVKMRMGSDFRYENMTDEEKARFGDIRSDIRMRKQGVRSAQDEYFSALREGEQKNVDFRNSLKESNRLTALGLAGGGEFQWGKDTAKNTAKIVSLLEEVNSSLKSRSVGEVGGISVQYGY